MRKEFSQAVLDLALQDDSIVFITGDLGFNALENVQEALGRRFVNAGVAEQNMVSVAAGLAYKGFKVFCYSIAPFVVYRCLEQFRNDVGFHNLPVFLVGNGGGYGYGIMGSSHHCLEDLACLSGLQNVKAWVPAFSDEVEGVVGSIVREARPAYLRLGAGKTIPDHSYISGSFRVLRSQADAPLTVVALGPMANNALEALKRVSASVNVLSALTFPLEISPEIWKMFANSPAVLVVEEHVSTGGLAQQLSVQLMEHGISVKAFKSLRAQGYPNGLYGSQSYHQKISGLDPDHITMVVNDLLAK